MTWNKIPIAIIFLLALGGGWFAHSYYITHVQDRSMEVIQVRENSSDYTFINPLIFVSDRRNIEFGEYADLKNQLEQYISKAMKAGKIKNASIYFRDLNGGEWISVNSEVLYAPSSMMKVATLMAYLKLAENNQNILYEKVLYTPTGTTGQTYKVERQLAAGMYPVKTLLEQMIIESDNDAAVALNGVHTEEVLKIYKDLELPNPLSDEIDFMSIGAYSRLFRTLYNGSYISRTYSEYALELLSKTKFNKGITASTGATMVSHKFGELTYLQKGKDPERELHDCGIVYEVGSPYTICIMTQGSQFSELQKVIADLSKIVFEYPKS